MSKESEENRLWSLRYSFSSLRRQPLKNLGIVVFLAFNIAIPTTVFSWTDTSIYLTIEDHFSDNAYQLLATTSLQSDFSILESLEERGHLYETIEAIDFFPSTVGILTNSNLPLWSTYFPQTPMPVYGINDFRVMPVTNEIIDRIEGEFVWIGNSSLSVGEILISERLVYHVRRTHEIQLQPGMTLDFDILPSRPTSKSGDTLLGYRSDMGIINKENFTIAGIYKLKTLSTLIGQAFPSILRQDPWPEHTRDMESVLGVEDSVMILRDEIEPEDLNLISREGYFNPVSLFRGDIETLVDLDPNEIEDNLLEVKVQVEDAVPRVSIVGATTLAEITTVIEAYEKGQMLSLVALPVIFLSIFVTIYTAESSLTHRKLEITVLRSKGASYNQILSSIMWESITISILGLVTGFFLTMIMTPMIGSSTGMFSYDFEQFQRFFYSLRITRFSITIAFMLSLFLPGLYLYQIERRINVIEIGNPVKEEDDERIKESNITLYAIILIVLLLSSFYLPILLDAFQVSSVAGLILLTLTLILGAYFGSRVIQLGISKIYQKVDFNLGESSIYVYQSLRRRKGKFIPLMIILTLSLTSSTMMLIESSSFTETMKKDILYSFGGDLRAEAYVPYSFSIVDTLEQNERINLVTPVTTHTISLEDHHIMMIGVDALKYLDIGTFTSDTFPDSSASDVLNSLESTEFGAVIPKYYAELFSKEVGDNLQVRVMGIWPIDLTIVGVMESAPGFGDAYVLDSNQDTIVSSLGFQVRQEGFILVNYELVSAYLRIYETDLFLMDIVLDSDFPDLYDEILSQYRFDLKTPHWELLPERERLIVVDDSVFYSTQSPIYYEIERFTRGLQGISFVCMMISIVLALSSIVLFFGSAINERRSEYAILRAVGARRNHIYSIVLTEFAGLVVTTLLVSIGLGFIFGYTATFLILNISPFSPILSESVAIYLPDAIIVFGAELVSLMLACYYPARKAAGLDVLLDLRNL